MRQMSFVRLSDVFKLNSIDKTLHCEVNCLNKRQTILFFVKSPLLTRGSGVGGLGCVDDTSVAEFGLSDTSPLIYSALS